MNLKQLKVFCEIVEAGSASAASVRLFTAATAVSMQISQLEVSMGGKLFDRSTRPMSLTPLGAFLYPKARELLADANQITEEVKGIAAGNRGWLSIGFVRSTIFSVLPNAVREMRNRFPGVRIDLVEMLSEQQALNIRNASIHIGLSRQIGTYAREPDMRYVPLLRDPLVAAVPADHALASQQTLHPRDLDALPFICFPKDPFSRFSSQSLDYLRAGGGTPTVGYEAKEIHTALGLVAAGLGMTLVGQTVAENQRTDVKFLPLQGPPLETEIFALVPLVNPHVLSVGLLTILQAHQTGAANANHNADARITGAK